MAWNCYKCGKSNNDETSKCTECFCERIVLEEKKVEQDIDSLQSKKNNIKGEKDDENEWIGNLSIIIALIAMISSLFFYNSNIELLSGIAGISLFMGKVFNPKNNWLTFFIIFSIIVYFGPIYVLAATCNNCPG